MTQRDPVIAAVADANPVDPAAPGGPSERAQADVIRRRAMNSPVRRRPSPSGLVPVISLLVALVVVGLISRLGATPSDKGRAPGGKTNTLVLQALPTPQTPVITRAATERELAIVRQRLAGISGQVQATLISSDQIRVQVGRHVPADIRSRIAPLLTQTAQLAFYDWEATVLAPGGKTVASQLATGDRTALAISQGSGRTPGVPGTGAQSLYQAVFLASKQRAAGDSPALTRRGPQYYLFARADSAACDGARAAGRAAPGANCLLAGPIDETPGTTRRQAVQDLARDLPAGVTISRVRASHARVLAVPQGIVVLQAANPTSQQTSFTSPDARFFVLKDQAALTGNDITDPRPSTDPAGAPDVHVHFTAAGAANFQSATARIAQRGARLSRSGLTYEQHVAVALNNQLLTVAGINFRQYPDGVSEKDTHGQVDITGAMTPTSAKAIAGQLGLGAQPLSLRVTG